LPVPCPDEKGGGLTEIAKETASENQQNKPKHEDIDSSMTDLNESRKEVQFLKQNSILTAKKLTKLGTWNVRTLYQCGKLSQLLSRTSWCTG